MKLPETLSIRHLALTFITAMLVLVAALGGYALYLSAAVTQSLAQSEMRDARDEVLTHIKRLLEQTESQAAAIARWDETQQQLVMPEYYGYWRDQRVYEAGMLPQTVARIALYTPSGSLINPLSQSSPMPPSLPLSARSSWLVNESGSIALYQRVAVHGDELGKSLLGYGLIRVDLLPALLQQSVFYQADKDTLRLTIQDTEGKPCSELTQSITLHAGPL